MICLLIYFGELFLFLSILINIFSCFNITQLFIFTINLPIPKRLNSSKIQYVYEYNYILINL